MKKYLALARGLASASQLRRIESLEIILSFLLSRLPEKVKERHLHLAPRLPDGCMSQARLYAHRGAMLHALPKGGCVGEVGTLRGDFSVQIASICQPDIFHLFDIDFSPLNEADIRARFSGEIVKHSGDSSTNVATLPSGYFDWLYIDACHSYDAVQNDLAAAHTVLKPGGYLLCNDYTNWDCASAQPYGVAKAVNEFIVAYGYEVLGLALEPAGYHDLMIRRPLARLPDEKQPSLR